MARIIVLFCVLLSASGLKAQLSVPFWFRPAVKSASETAPTAAYARFLEGRYPIGFGTFESGELGIAFKKNEKVVWRISEWFEPPHPIHVFSDMLVLEGTPFEFCKVQLIFWTERSGLILWDVRAENMGKADMDLEVMPTQQRFEQSWSNVVRTQDYRSILSTHLDESMQPVRSAFTQFKPADGLLAWNSVDSSSAMLPFLFTQETNVAIGQIFNRQAAPARAWPDSYRFQLVRLGVSDTLYTERSGGVVQSFTDGSVSLNFDGFKSDLRQQVRFTVYRKADEDVGYEFLSPNQTEDFVVMLGSGRIPPPPTDVRLSVRNNSRNLQWQSPGVDMKFSVYRRIYPDVAYVKMTNNLKVNHFEDTEILPPGSIVGYVVLSTNSGGMPSIQSEEVNNVAIADALEQFQNPQFFIGKDVFSYPTDWMLANSMRGMAFYNKMNLKPGQKGQIRGYQELENETEPTKAKSSIAREDLMLLLSADWNAFIKERQKK